MKMIPYGRQTIDDKDIRAVLKVLRSDWLTQGPNIDLFEKALCVYTGARFAVCVSNGTAALHLAYLALGLKKGDEVITSPLTFVATANAALYLGAKPVFADIKEDTGNLDGEAIKKKINKKTRLIIPVHFGGRPCPMQEIYQIAQKNKIAVVEDAAHALGASYQAEGKWWKIGSCRHSQMAVFSFHPVKSITCAEGGAIMTNDEALYKKLIKLRSHGITKEPTDFVLSHGRSSPWHYEMQDLGYNFRISDMQCALGLSQLKKLDGFVKRRDQIARIYSMAWADSIHFDVPAQDKEVLSAWHLYPIRLKSPFAKHRREFFCLLRSLGLGVQVHYIPVYLQPYYTKLQYKKDTCPRAQEFYESEISLPLYPAMSDGDIKQVIAIVDQATKKLFKGI